MCTIKKMFLYETFTWHKRWVQLQQRSQASNAGLPSKQPKDPLTGKRALLAVLGFWLATQTTPCQVKKFQCWSFRYRCRPLPKSLRRTREPKEKVKVTAKLSILQFRCNVRNQSAMYYAIRYGISFEITLHGMHSRSFYPQGSTNEPARVGRPRWRKANRPRGQRMCGSHCSPTWVKAMHARTCSERRVWRSEAITQSTRSSSCNWRDADWWSRYCRQSSRWRVAAIKSGSIYTCVKNTWPGRGRILRHRSRSWKSSHAPPRIDQRSKTILLTAS